MYFAYVGFKLTQIRSPLVSRRLPLLIPPSPALSPRGNVAVVNLPVITTPGTPDIPAPLLPTPAAAAPAAAVLPAVPVVPRGRFLDTAIAPFTNPGIVGEVVLACGVDDTTLLHQSKVRAPANSIECMAKALSVGVFCIW